MRPLLRLACVVALLLASAVMARAGVSYDESPAFTFDTREYLGGLAAESATFAFDTQAVDGLSGSGVSGLFGFDTRVLTLASITVAGPPNLGAGGSANFTATAHYSNATTEDICNLAAWFVSGGPSGTQMVGRRLQAGVGAASVAQVQASRARDNGGRTSDPWEVAIGAGLAVRLNTVTGTHTAGVGNSLTCRIAASATATGASGALAVTWTFNGALLAGQTGLTLDSSVSTAPGPATLAVSITDGAGRTGNARYQLLLGKAPNPNERQPHITPRGYNPGTLYGVDGVASPAIGSALWNARKANGLVVIAHGFEDGVDSGWMTDLATEIAGKFGSSLAPNILLYDWQEDAAPFGRTDEEFRAANCWLSNGCRLALGCARGWSHWLVRWTTGTQQLGRLRSKS